MTIREMVEKYRTNCTVEIRCNNFKVMEFHSEDYKMVKDELLDKEISNWFVMNENSLIRTRDRIVLDCKDEGAVEPPQEPWKDAMLNTFLKR